MAKLQSIQGQETSWSMLLQAYSNQRVWLDHLALILDFFIKSNDELKELTKGSVDGKDTSVNADGTKKPLEKIPEEVH